MMKTKVFAYKGYIGIDSNPAAEGLVAKPGEGNLGCVCDAAFVEVSEEALALLKTIPKGRDSLGEIDIFGSVGKVIFAWMGGYQQVIDPKKVTTSRDYDPTLLIEAAGIEPTDTFKEFIDSLESKTESAPAKS